MTHLHKPSSIERIWRRYDADEVRLTAAVSQRMLDVAGLEPGMRVVDIATGRGEPAIRAAKRVGPTGSVTGVDIAADMLGMTRERATAEGITNLELLHANPEDSTVLLPEYYHCGLARWGLMYFDDPLAALHSIHRALVPGGIFVAAYWAEPERVNYFSLPRELLQRYKRLPPMDPQAPGAFRFATIETIERFYSAAPFKILAVEELETAVMEADTDRALIDWTRAFGMARLLEDLPESIQHSWEADLVRAAAPLKSNGFVRLGGTTRLVVAQRLPTETGA